MRHRPVLAAGFLVLAAALAACSGAPVAGASAATTPTGGCGRYVAGDTNGDGRSDPVIGVPGKHASVGQADLFRGTATGVVPAGFVQLGAKGSLTAALPGVADAPHAAFGAQVVSADIDGDRCADVAITAPFDASEPHGRHDTTHPVQEHGSITVLYGHAGTGLRAAGAQLLTAHSLGIETAGIADDLVVQTLERPVFGDFDGDGYADLAAVDFRYDSTADSATAAIVVLPGSADGLVESAAREIAIPEVVATTQLIRLAAGDSRGGRYDDLAVGIGGAGGATTVVPGDTDSHAVVRVLYGASGGLGTGASTVAWDRESAGVPGSDATDMATWPGGVPEPVSVAFGDFDGDGRADLAYGLDLVNTVVVLPGSATGVTSSRSEALTYGTGGLLGTATDVNGRFGSQLATGDFNGDGDDELVVGAYRAGHVSVIPGSPSGLTTAGDLLWAEDTPGIPGARRPDRAFGATLSTGWFGRGPGMDLLVGDPAAAVGSGGGGSGSVTELFGSTTRNVGLVKAGARLITESTAGVPGPAVPSDHFGSTS